CTGTSMASPYVAGIAGLIRSVNPLLSTPDTKTALAAGATITPGYTAMQMGACYPDAETAVKKALGGLLAGYEAPSTAFYGDPLLGYVYPNVDSDKDGLVDGFELTVGTDPDTDDSDCDGQLDKAEFPLAALPVSDPAEGPNCAVRALSILLNDDE
ncbi:MAG TPA: S8 family serine peptidase, partial [Tahibacter sp.]|nr:S8 family serine peptidase [Tahibacter sp.]